MPGSEDALESWKRVGAPWLEAAQEWTDTALEYCRDCLDVRTPQDFLDVNAFYADRQARTWMRLLGADRLDPGSTAR